VRLWDLWTGEESAVLEGHDGVVNAVCAMTLDGQAVLVSGGTDYTVRLWDPLTSRQLFVMDGHKEGVQTNISTTGDHGVNAVGCVTVGTRTFPVSGGRDKTVRLWDPRTGSCLLTMPTHHRIQDVAGVSGSLAITLDEGILMIKPDADPLSGRPR